MQKCFKKLFSIIIFLSCIFYFYGFTNVFGVDDEGIISDSAPKFSIVMPVYNVESYLDESLDSVENQTYKNLEVICVNDGSTDNSLKILKNHAKKDSRIKIIDQKNQGVSEARNVGMRAATGKYIFFCDPDDILAPYTLEKTVENMEKYNADMVKFKTSCFKHDEKIDFSKYSYDESLVNTYECDADGDGFKFFAENDIWVVWAQVYKRSLIAENRVEFDKNIGFGEDLVFNFIFSSFVKKIVVDDNIGYFYRAGRPGSICNTPQNESKWLDRHLTVIHALNQNSDKFDKEQLFECIYNYFVKYMYEHICGIKSNSPKSFYSRKGLKSKSQRCFYAKRAYEEVYKNFIGGNNIKLNEDHKKKLNDLKKWSECKPVNKKSKRQVNRGVKGKKKVKVNIKKC